MRGDDRLAQRTWIVLAVAWVLSLAASRASAQVTTYGQDPIPGASKWNDHWGGYGIDSVPHSRLDSGGYIDAYGSDRVPGTPSTHDLPQDAVRSILPNQTLQVLTGDEAGDTDSDCPPLGR